MSTTTRGRRAPLWLVSLALAAPAAIPYVVHVLPRTDGSLPTGYIFPDMALYMAKGREHFDSGQFRPTYGNPSGAAYDEPRIYVQPLFLMMGAAWRLSGLDPGAVTAIAWAVGAWLGAWSAVRLYREVVGLDSRSQRIGLVVFFWGGGLLVATGAAWYPLLQHRWPDARELFAFDPFNGWWFLSFGRNLVYPTEAFYHFVFLSCALAAIRRRFAAAAAWAALMAWSTPFTGSELLAILLAWGLLEAVFLGDPRMPRWFPAAIGAIAVAFVAYYVAFLGRFPEHRTIVRQMSLDWGYQAATFVPAYLPIAALAAWTLRTARHAAAFLAEPRSRLFLVWAAVAFGLSNHEFAVSPRQPIHFDRGYVWTALFFLAAPSLMALLDRIGRLPRAAGGVLTAAILAMFLLDNAAWLARFVVLRDRPGANDDLRQTPAERDVLRRVAGPEFFGHTLITDDPTLGVLSIAQTHLRPWAGQFAETPDYVTRTRELADLFDRGAFLPAWEDRPLVVALKARVDRPMPPSWLTERGARELVRSGDLAAYEILPGGRRPGLAPAAGRGDGPS